MGACVLVSQEEMTGTGARALMAGMIVYLSACLVVLVTDDSFGRLPMISEYYKLSRGRQFVGGGFFVFVAVVGVVAILCFLRGNYQDTRTLVLPAHLGSCRLGSSERKLQALHLCGSLFLAGFMLLVRVSQLPYHPIGHFLGCTGVQLALVASLFVYTIHAMAPDPSTERVLLAWKGRPLWTVLTLCYVLGPLSIFAGFLFKSRDNLFYQSWDVDDLYNSFSSLAEYAWAISVTTIWVKSAALVLPPHPPPRPEPV